MALQVWLPLNGNLNNQGLTNWQFTNNNATVDNSGKIGKCYAFSGSSQYLRLNQKVMDTSQFTISFWMYATDVSANHCIFSTRNVTSGAVNIYLLSAGIRFDTSTTANWQTGFKPSANTWYHITLVQDATTKYLYVNGVLNTSTAGTTDLTQVSSVCTIGCEHINGSSIGTYFAGKLNDFRIYSHALAPKEIEILSRGLVAHYPLSDRSNQTPNNVFTNPTFASSSGWGFWGQSGHSGTWNFTQNKDYIFNKTQTNACVISNGASATGDYLMYQSPAFSGGFRSLQAIIKEENSKAITDSIVYPVWNASASGSTPLNHWTSINDLGNGFYLCRCESIKQDGSNNLVGIYVKPGYKIYVSECYCENDRTVCSDFFYPSTTVYDTSGFKNNGTISGSLTTSNDTARYSASTYIPKAGYIQHPNALGSDTMNQEWTCCAWVKLDSTVAAQQLNDFNLGNNVVHAANSTPLLYLNAGTHDYYRYGSVAIQANVWTHIAFVFRNFDGLRNVYVNGVLTNSSSAPNKDSTPAGIPSTVTIFGGNFDGYVSDYREYATALSAAQVAELYNTAVSVANNGTLMGYELVEV